MWARECKIMWKKREVEWGGWEVRDCIVGWYECGVVRNKKERARERVILVKST